VSRLTANPVYVAAYLGGVDVSDADTNWHSLASDDLYDLTDNTVTTKLGAGHNFTSLTAYNSAAGAARIRLSDTTGAAAAAHSVIVPAGGSVSLDLRGLGDLPNLSYRLDGTGDALHITAGLD
jgi:hypothetical protein